MFSRNSIINNRYGICLLFLFQTVTCLAQTPQKDVAGRKSITLDIYFPNTLKNDTLISYLSSDLQIVLTDPKLLQFGVFKSARDKNGWYHFEFPNSNQGYSYINLYKIQKKSNNTLDSPSISKTGDNRTELLPYYLLKDGDRLKMSVQVKGKIEPRRGYRHNFSYKFHGVGATMQNLRYGLDSIAYNVITGSLLKTDSSYNLNNYENEIIHKSVAYLAYHRKNLSDDDFDLLKAHAIYSAKSDEGLLFAHLYKKELQKQNVTKMKKFLESYDSTFYTFEKQISPKALSYSKRYSEAEFNHCIVRSMLAGANNQLDSLFNEIKKKHAGLLRDQLLSIYFERYGKMLPGAIDNLAEAQTLITSKKYYEYIASLNYSPGSLAYNFNLSDSSGKRVKLSDFKEKIIFVDFWYTGCGNCLLFYANELSKAEEYFKNDREVIFITISIDKFKDFWLNSLKHGKYTSESAVNLYTDGQGGGNSVIKHYNIHTYPQPILIGKDQRILMADDRLRSASVIIQRILKEKAN